ncbi:MAG TPA: class I SAM-dependent methyltransferase [Polyangiaceae bacterium]|jgi:SAM-dependent methyltransferase|nr:class I SAM-dependent methyltransferase [Polyangiaceae bacterium]
MHPNSTRTHYETLLAPIYRWMLGDMPTAFACSRAKLESCGIAAMGEGKRALDLGAGLGLHAIPLAAAGYHVTAIDSSHALLAELRAERPDVIAVAGDLLELNALALGSYDVIVCMGDTLTHLPSEPDAERLLEAACATLAPGGVFALTFRDYAGRTLEANERFILVRADDTRILTCLLEYSVDRVQVTDIVHERSENAWTMRASTHAKLRLSADWVQRRIEVAGCAVARAESVNGRICIVATRKSSS